MKKLIEPSQNNEMLAKWRGSHAMIWSFSISHTKLALRLQRSGEHEVLYVLAGCEYIAGPFSWNNSAISFVSGEESGDPYDVTIMDKKAGFELRCDAMALMAGLSTDADKTMDIFWDDGRIEKTKEEIEKSNEKIRRLFAQLDGCSQEKQQRVKESSKQEVAPMITIIEPGQTNEILAKWHGYPAKIWVFDGSLTRLVIGLTRQRESREIEMLYIIGTSCEHIRGRFSWKDSWISIVSGKESGEAFDVIVDKRAGFELRCHGVVLAEGPGSLGKALNNLLEVTRTGSTDLPQ